MSAFLETREKRWKVPPGQLGHAAHWQPWLQAEPGWTLKVRGTPPEHATPTLRGRTLCGVRVPAKLEDLAQTVEKSRWILDLKPDWDGQGSPAYSRETWEKAASLLLAGAVDYFERFDQLVPVPAFENGPEGSIDIHWEMGDRGILLNIPAEPEAPVRYYGRSSSGFEIKGTVSLADQRKWFPLLLQWLLE